MDNGGNIFVADTFNNRIQKFGDCLSHTPTVTQTNTPSATGTITHTITLTATPSTTPTSTDSITATYSSTSTVTPTSTITNTSTPSPTSTQTQTYTATATITLTVSQTDTPTITPTSTDTMSFTSTPTATPTFTDTATYTITQTFTNSPTITQTSTVTPTPLPSPVELVITKKALQGEEPAIGASITYEIDIQNPGYAGVNNLVVWDTLPGEVSYQENVSGITPVVYGGNVLVWNLGGPFNPGSVITLQFIVQIVSLDEGNTPIKNVVSADYNDPMYNGMYGRHPVITSNVSFYPAGLPVVYPNPFNPRTARNGKMKFDNLIPSAQVEIYTVVGEEVWKSGPAQGIKIYWDGKTNTGNEVKTGGYYYIIKNGQWVYKGKLLLIRE